MTFNIGVSLVIFERLQASLSWGGSLRNSAIYVQYIKVDKRCHL